MKPTLIGKKYDKIAVWWQEQHVQSDYGVAPVVEALGCRSGGGSALDIGCGAGGRIVQALDSYGYDVTGLDVSAEMIRLAAANHPQSRFINQDVSVWETDKRFEFIVAWDSIFHLPLSEQPAVIEKLCRWLAEGGVLIYTFGSARGEHTDAWRGDIFYYSSIGMDENIRILTENGLTVLHAERDQYPETHAYTISRKP